MERSTAVVVTHNSADRIGAALEPLLRAGCAVRVVDNASRDGTAALVAARYPAVTLHANPENVGFARAVNQALSDLDTDTVLLVNPDCVVPPHTAHALVAHLRRHPEVGIVGPRLVDADGATANSAHPFESLASVAASRFGGALLPRRVKRRLAGTARDRVREVDWLSGACLAVRADLLARTGGLDPGYFLYYEDEELCLRAWRHRYRVVYLPTVDAAHAGGASSADPAHLWPHLYRSMLRFFARHRRAQFQAVRAVVVTRALLGIALAGTRLLWQPGAGVARARAWTRVTRIALTADPEALERTPCTY